MKHDPVLERALRAVAEERRPGRLTSLGVFGLCALIALVIAVWGGLAALAEWALFGRATP